MNLTLSIDEKQEQKDSLFIDEWFRLMDKNNISMAKRSWSRDELHER